jgi:hypothetical protein
MDRRCCKAWPSRRRSSGRDRAGPTGRCAL